MKTLDECLALSPDDLRAACEAAGITVAGFTYGAFYGHTLAELVAEAHAFAAKHGVEPAAIRIDTEGGGPEDSGHIIYVVEPPHDLADEQLRKRYAKELHDTLRARAARQREIETNERAELARLQKKYGGGAQ